MRTVVQGLPGAKTLGCKGKRSGEPGWGDGGVQQVTSRAGELARAARP